MAQQSRREEQQQHSEHSGAPAVHTVCYQTAKQHNEPAQQRIADVARACYVINAESLVNPLRNDIERAAIIFQIPVLILAVQVHHVLHTGSVLSVRMVIVHHEPTLRYLELILVAAVAGIEAHQGHCYQQHCRQSHKKPEPNVTLVL